MHFPIAKLLAKSLSLSTIVKPHKNEKQKENNKNILRTPTKRKKNISRSHGTFEFSIHNVYKAILVIRFLDHRIVKSSSKHEIDNIK